MFPQDMQLPGEDWIFSWYVIFFAMFCGGVIAFKQYMKGAPCQSTERVKGKTIIITGANSGMGKETAKELLKRGARVILACRDVEKGEEAVNDIKEQLRKKELNAVVMKLDLSSFISVREFAKEFLKNESKLDVLINNAGVILLPERILSKDGFEMQLASNYLGHFLLTHLLLDRLESSAPSRIINMSAVAYQLADDIDLEDMNYENKEYNRSNAYAQSKLAVLLFTREMSRILEGTKVTVNAVHPGVVNSPGLRHMPFKSSPFLSLSFTLPIWYFTKSSKDGAQTTIYLAVASDVETVSGKFFVECAEKEVTENACNDDLAKKLYGKSLEWTGLNKKTK
ncbi:unnamed protein product [Owenia fusiformis]|uniref:Uncharacterized protein n=1 Tax=Owenia fusiformis TaxID=6347 RepID=A0A8J1U2T2_OWEFU|nr:unnamed protein product [Owenia fusiformis]